MASMKVAVFLSLACFAVSSEVYFDEAKEKAICGNGIRFVTDIEGDTAYFDGLKKSMSDIMFAEKLKPGHCIVVGGDMVDKGDSSIRAVKHFVNLKKASPSQVFLLLGNRDLNKLRYWSELPVKSIPDVPDFVKKGSYKPWAKFKAPEESDQKRFALWKASTGEPFNVKNRLNFIFKDTMGAPDNWEFRKTEMIALGVANPTDEAIAESIFRDVDHRKGGAMWEYISKGHLAVQIGKNFFCHGGVTENNFLVDPKTHTAKSANSGAWVKRLEEWKTAQLQEIKIMPACKEDSCQMRGGNGLIDYALPPNLSGEAWDGVVTARGQTSNNLVRRCSGLHVPFPPPLSRLLPACVSLSGAVRICVVLSTCCCLRP
jgi:hypothetical protein